MGRRSGIALSQPAETTHPKSRSRVMESIKDGTTKRFNQRRRECGTLLQPRFIDRALRYPAALLSDRAAMNKSRFWF